MRLASVLASALVSVLAAAPALAQDDPEVPQQPPESVDLRSGGSQQLPIGTNVGATAEQIAASHLIGADVYGSDGESLGQIVNLLLNRRTNAVDLLVVDTGGTGSDEERQVAIPWVEIEFEHDNVPKITSSLEAKDLEAAPAFAESADVRKDFVNFDTELEGSDATLPDGQTLGTVEDLLLEKESGAVLGAMVHTDDTGLEIGQAGAPRFFPWATVQNAPDQDEGLVLAVTPEDVEKAPFFGNIAPEGGVPPQE